MSTNDPIAVRLSASWEMDRPPYDVAPRVCKLNIVELLWFSNPTCSHFSPASSTCLHSSQVSNAADHVDTPSGGANPKHILTVNNSLSLPGQQQANANLRTSPNHASTVASSSSSHHPASCQNLFLTVRLRHSPRRILRSPEIHVASSLSNSHVVHDPSGTPYSALSMKLNVHCNILYSHFLKKDTNVLQIVVQRRKNYKNKTMVLGYKTLAYCNIDLSLILQQRLENRYFELYSSADYDDKPCTVLGRIHILCMSSMPLDKESNAFHSTALSVGKRNSSTVSSNVFSPTKLKEECNKAVSLFSPSKASDSNRSLSVRQSILTMEQDYNSCDNGEDSYIEEALDSGCSIVGEKGAPSPQRESVFGRNKTMKMMKEGVRRQFKEKLAGLMKKMKIQESQEDDLDENTAALWAEIEKLETVSDLAEGSLDEEDDDDNSDDSISFSPESTPKPGLRPFYSNSRFSLERPNSFRGHKTVEQGMSRGFPFTSIDPNNGVPWNNSKQASADITTDSSASFPPKPDYSSFESEDEDELDASTLSTGFISSALPTVSSSKTHSIPPPSTTLFSSSIPMDNEMLAEEKQSSSLISPSFSSSNQPASDHRGAASAAPSHQTLQTLHTKLSSKFNHLLSSNPLHHAFSSSTAATTENIPPIDCTGGSSGATASTLPQPGATGASHIPRFPSSITSSKVAQAARDRAAVFRDKLRHISNPSSNTEVNKKSSVLQHGNSLPGSQSVSATQTETPCSAIQTSRNSAEVQPSFNEPVLPRKRSGSVQLEPNISPPTDFLNISSGSGALVTELNLLRASSAHKGCTHISPPCASLLEPHRETVQQTTAVIEHEQRCHLSSPVIFLVYVAACPTGRAVCDALLKANRLTVAIRNSIDAKHFFTHLLSRQHRSRSCIPLRICLVGREDTHINYVLQSYVELLGAKFPEQLGSQYRFYVAPLPFLHMSDHLSANGSTAAPIRESWFIHRLANMDSAYANLFQCVSHLSHPADAGSENHLSATLLSSTITEFLTRLDSYVEKAVHVANINIGECLVVGKFKSDDNKDDELSELVLPFIGAVRSGDADQTLLHHIFPNVICTTPSCWCHDPSLEDCKTVKPCVTSNTSLSSPLSSVTTNTVSSSVIMSSTGCGDVMSSSSAPVSSKSLEVTLDYWQEVSTASSIPSSHIPTLSTSSNTGAISHSGGRTLRPKASSIKTTTQAICILPEVWEEGSIDSPDLLSLAWNSKERKQKLMRIGRKGREHQEPLRMDVLHRLTKVICCNKNQNSIMKISVDGVEYNNVKYFQVSPNWRTHVKYFPTAVFSAYSSQ